MKRIITVVVAIIATVNIAIGEYWSWEGCNGTGFPEKSQFKEVEFTPLTLAEKIMSSPNMVLTDVQDRTAGVIQTDNGITHTVDYGNPERPTEGCILAKDENSVCLIYWFEGSDRVPEVCNISETGIATNKFYKMDGLDWVKFKVAVVVTLHPVPSVNGIAVNGNDFYTPDGKIICGECTGVPAKKLMSKHATLLGEFIDQSSIYEGFQELFYPENFHFKNAEGVWIKAYNLLFETEKNKE